MDLSIVSTLYQSAPYLKEFHDRVTKAALELTDDFEIVLVNDGSPDESMEVALSLFEQDDRLRIVEFSRNFGHHRAMMVGLEHARGERVLLIDSDLEEPPEVLAQFQRTMEETGADVVFGVQSGRLGSWLHRAKARLFYAVVNWFSTDPIPRNLLTLRLMTHRYVAALTAHRERQTMIAGLWEITGFEQVPLPVKKGYKGATTYSLRLQIAHVVNAITSFSHKPLIIVFYTGVMIMVPSFIGAVYLVIRYAFFDTALEGWPSLIISLWFLGGLTVFSIGIVGIYLSRVFIETKQRPYAIIKRTYEH